MINIKNFNIFLESMYGDEPDTTFTDDMECGEDLLPEIYEAEDGTEEKYVGELELLIDKLFELLDVDKNIIKKYIEGDYVVYYSNNNSIDYFVDIILFNDNTFFEEIYYNNDVHVFKYKYLTFVVVDGGVEVCGNYYGKWVFTSEVVHRIFKQIDKNIFKTIGNNLKFWEMIIDNSAEEFIFNIKTIKNFML